MQSVSSDLDWNDLRYFLAIAEAGSLAGASRALAVNHSTVFRRLNLLEKRLGVRLFDRLPGGYALTREGEEIRRHAQRIDESVNALERAAVGRDFRLSGTVRVTAPSMIATDYLVGYLVDFRQRYPDIEIEIATGDRDFDLARREADVAVRATASPPDFLVGRPVVSLPWFACASPAFLAREGRPTSLADLARFAQIGADESFQRLPVFAWQRRTFPAERLAVRANEIATMRALAIAGLGVAFLPADQMHPDLERLHAVDAAFSGHLWLLTHPDLRHVARVKVFMEYLYTRFRGDPRFADWINDGARVQPPRKAPRAPRRRAVPERG
jgi:DNA-binding transcriptional LysR family regulator